VLDKMQARLDHMPEAMTIRRQTVEHLFGTLKAWDGQRPFPDQDSRKGQNRDEPAGAGLQKREHRFEVRSGRGKAADPHQVSTAGVVTY
jgi:hypothetical protein